jgi:hypothetical protein
MTFGAYTWVIVKTAKSDAEFRGAIGAVYNRRAADAAEAAMKSG